MVGDRHSAGGVVGDQPLPAAELAQVGRRRQLQRQRELRALARGLTGSGRAQPPQGSSPTALAGERLTGPRPRQLLERRAPRAGARAFMGMLVVYVLGREVFVPIGAGFPSAEIYAKEVTKIFLNGLATPPS